MTDLFRDIMPTILSTHGDALLTEADENAYCPVVVGRALSQHPDCVLYAVEADRMRNVPVRMQYDYLRYSIRKRKRAFMKWPKKTKYDDVESIKLYFGYSTRKAVDVLRSGILTDDQLEMIREVTKVGDI